jgi:[amino group carrier protein]-lysine/ornithine hydrolase
MNELDLLEGLLKIYSPSYQERAAVDYLVARMKEMGLRAFCDKAGNAVGVVEPPPSPSSPPLRPLRFAPRVRDFEPLGPETRGVEGDLRPAEQGREIVLLGHIDTAPGVVEVRRADGKLYGRGAVDAKGPLCAFASAAARVGPREGWRIVVVGAVEEECPTSKGAHFAKTQYAPEFALVGEPSGWDRVTLGYKGSLWVDYALTRAMAHSAGRPRSAAEEAVDFWLAVKSYADEFNRGQTRVFDKLDPTLRGMLSESDGLQEIAKLTIGLRLPVGVGVRELEEKIAELANGASLQFSTQTPAFRAEKNNALVRAFLAAIRAEQGEPGFTLKTGTSDMNILGPYWQCPIVTYGPGDSNLDHTPDEHIELEEYEKSIAVVARVLEALTPPPGFGHPSVRLRPDA